MLGFAEGAVIDRAVFEALFGEHLDPRDPSGENRLGRAPQRFASEKDVYDELLAAEPHASGARRSELRSLARAQVRRAVPFWDVTVSVSKSVTLFHGGWLALAERAREAGDDFRAGFFERQAGRVWEAIMEGNAAALEYLQDEAGVTRTGYHRGSGAESRAEVGRWEHARDWVIGSFRMGGGRMRGRWIGSSGTWRCGPGRASTVSRWICGGSCASGRLRPASMTWPAWYRSRRLWLGPPGN